LGAVGPIFGLPRYGDRVGVDPDITRHGVFALGERGRGHVLYRSTPVAQRTNAANKGATQTLALRTPLPSEQAIWGPPKLQTKPLQREIRFGQTKPAVRELAFGPDVTSNAKKIVRIGGDARRAASR